MVKQAFFLLMLAASTAPAVGEGSCQALQLQIEAKIRAAGVQSFSLVTVEAQAEVPGTVVGRCAQGARKIVYASHAPTAVSRGTSPGAASAPPGRPAGKVVSTRRDETILTECKDGSVSVDGTCKP